MSDIMTADDMDEPNPEDDRRPRIGAIETSDAVSAAEVLKSMFSVVLAEAERNPRFAEKLIAALPTNAVVEVKGGRAKKPAAEAPPFDPHAFSLVATFRKEGGDKLRDRLDKLTKDQVTQMADAQTISLTPADLRKRKSAIITATIKATEARLADRFAAAD